VDDGYVMVEAPLDTGSMLILVMAGALAGLLYYWLTGWWLDPS
jgi:hypothetical protein